MGRAALRVKLRDSLTGLIAFAFSATGSYRAGKYKQVNPKLADHVFQSWQVEEEQARTVGNPLGDTIAEHLPDKWLAGLATGIDPVQALGAAYLLVSECMAGEQQVVGEYHEWLLRAQSAPEDHGPAEDVPEHLLGTAGIEHPSDLNGSRSTSP